MKNLKLNLEKIIRLRGIPLVLATTILATGLTGCGKKAECDVSGNHAHLYVNEQNFIRYIDKEYLTYEGYERQDEYVEIDSEEKDLYKFMDKKDLLRIEDNIDAISTLENGNHDYIEYRYAYTYLMPIPHYIRTGKTSSVYYTYIPTTHYSWTSNPEHSRLTGEQRRCHYVYQGFNVAKDEKGKYVLIPSEYVDSISDLNGEYEYINEKFYKVIDAEYGYDLDYEDGVEDDPDLIEENDVTVNNENTNGNVVTQSYNSADVSQKRLIKRFF